MYKWYMEWFEWWIKEFEHASMEKKLQQNYVNFYLEHVPIVVSIS
jgi:hypothetical protein